MPVPITSEFTLEPDQLVFTTKTNGDHLEIKNVHLGAENAANLAELINTPGIMLNIEIKEA